MIKLIVLISIFFSCSFNAEEDLNNYRDVQKYNFGDVLEIGFKDSVIGSHKHVNMIDIKVPISIKCLFSQAEQYTVIIQKSESEYIESLYGDINEYTISINGESLIEEKYPLFILFPQKKYDEIRVDIKRSDTLVYQEYFEIQEKGEKGEVDLALQKIEMLRDGRVMLKGKAIYIPKDSNILNLNGIYGSGTVPPALAIDTTNVFFESLQDVNYEKEFIVDELNDRVVFGVERIVMHTNRQNVDFKVIERTLLRYNVHAD